MLEEYYLFFETFFPFITLSFGIYAYGSMDFKLKILCYFVFFASISSTASYLISRTGTNNMPELHVYVLFEFILLTLFYVNSIKEYINRKFIWVIIGGFVVLSILNALFFQEITKYPYILRAIESIVIVIFSILYFHKVMVEAKIKKLFKEPMIWINTAMLVYFSINFFFHILLPIVVMKTLNEFAREMVYFYWATNILFYMLIAIGFYKQKKLVK